MSRVYSEDELHALIAIRAARDQMGRIAHECAQADTDVRWSRGFVNDEDTRDRIKALADRIVMLEREAGIILAELDRLRREVQA